MQAGPGIVEAPDDNGILDAEQSENPDLEQAEADAVDEAAESAPPGGSNQ